jgi:hypothetical protein
VTGVQTCALPIFDDILAAQTAGCDAAAKAALQQLAEKASE